MSNKTLQRKILIRAQFQAQAQPMQILTRIDAQRGHKLLHLLCFNVHLGPQQVHQPRSVKSPHVHLHDQVKTSGKMTHRPQSVGLGWRCFVQLGHHLDDIARPAGPLQALAQAQQRSFFQLRLGIGEEHAAIGL